MVVQQISVGRPRRVPQLGQLVQLPPLFRVLPEGRRLRRLLLLFGLAAVQHPVGQQRLGSLDQEVLTILALHPGVYRLSSRVHADLYAFAFSFRHVGFSFRHACMVCAEVFKVRLTRCVPRIGQHCILFDGGRRFPPFRGGDDSEYRGQLLCLSFFSSLSHRIPPFPCVRAEKFENTSTFQPQRGYRNGWLCRFFSCRDVLLPYCARISGGMREKFCSRRRVCS